MEFRADPREGMHTRGKASLDCTLVAFGEK